MPYVDILFIGGPHHNHIEKVEVNQHRIMMKMPPIDTCSYYIRTWMEKWSATIYRESRAAVYETSIDPTWEEKRALDHMLSDAPWKISRPADYTKENDEWWRQEILRGFGRLTDIRGDMIPGRVKIDPPANLPWDGFYTDGEGRFDG